jgi:hypothetical protein
MIIIMQKRDKVVMTYSQTYVQSGPSNKKVFPDLHKINDSSVTKKLSETIRKFIPKSVSKDVRNSFSAKSMRKGAINYMAAHTSTDFYESHVRSGHALGTSQENYIDRQALVFSITAAKALNSYGESAFACNPYSPPNFECLGVAYGVQSMVDEFITELYTISDKLPQFQPGGHLRPFLRMCTAVLVMSFNDIMKDFGFNRVSCVQIGSHCQ